VTGRDDLARHAECTCSTFSMGAITLATQKALCLPLQRVPDGALKMLPHTRA
jgi:hypothetical protein